MALQDTIDRIPAPIAIDVCRYERYPFARYCRVTITLALTVPARAHLHA